MKKLILVAGLVYAGATFGARTNAQIHASCTGFSETETARLIMEERQKGTPVSQVMKAMIKVDAQMGVGEFWQERVTLAYAKPHYRSKQSQQRAVAAFENDTYAACRQGSR